MNSKRNVKATALSFLLVSLAASCGCMCTQDLCNPHSSSLIGSQRLPCHTATGGCLRPMPVGYYPTTWQPLLAITTDHSYELEVNEELPPSPRVPPKLDTDRAVPKKPDAPKPADELGAPLLDKVDMSYDDIDPQILVAGG